MNTGPHNIPPEVKACIDRMTIIQKQMKEKKMQFDGIRFGTPKALQASREAEIKEEMANLGLLLMAEQEKFDKLGMKVNDLVMQNPLVCEHTSLFCAQDIMVLKCRQCGWGTPINKDELAKLTANEQPGEVWLKSLKIRFKEMPKQSPVPTRRSAFIV